MLSRRDLLKANFSSYQQPVHLPWVRNELEFIDTCSRCHDCTSACSEKIIIKGDGGFPEINFNRGECTFCGDSKIRCDKAPCRFCGTGCSVLVGKKFEKKRLQLARNVWKAMKETDSRECRNCHDYKSMDYAEQGRRSMQQHSKGLEKGKTCIDCHKGIAHSLPAMYEVDPSAAVGAE